MTATRSGDRAEAGAWCVWSGIGGPGAGGREDDGQTKWTGPEAARELGGSEAGL